MSSVELNRSNTDEAVLAVLHGYFQGLFDGDVARLESAFHPDAQLFADTDGSPYQKRLPDYLATVANRQSPRTRGETFAMRVLAVEVIGGIARAKVQCPMLGFNYVDFLSLIRTDGEWRIVNKVFTHVDPERTETLQEKT